MIRTDTWTYARAASGHGTHILSLSVTTTVNYLLLRPADFVVWTIFRSFCLIHIVVDTRLLNRPYLGPSHSLQFQLDSSTYYTHSSDSFYQAVHHPSILLLWEYTHLYTFGSCNAPFRLVCSARCPSRSSSWISLFRYVLPLPSLLFLVTCILSPRAIKKWMTYLEFVFIRIDEYSRSFVIFLIHRFRISFAFLINCHCTNRTHSSSFIHTPTEIIRYPSIETKSMHSRRYIEFWFILSWHYSQLYAWHT